MYYFFLLVFPLCNLAVSSLLKLYQFI